MEDEKKGEQVKPNKEKDDESNESNSTPESSENENEFESPVRKTATVRLVHKVSQKLEKIHERDEDNYSTNRSILDNLDDNQEPHELITTLRNKITELEDKLLDLKSKNDELKKNNIRNDTKIRRMSFVGTRRKFNFGSKGSEKIKIAELIKEKNDLQVINEKMLAMLTDKELENEDLQDKFDKYKNDMKTQMQKYLQNIDELEEKIEILEEKNKSKENFDNNLDEIINEYNKYKERMEKTINEHIKKEEDLQSEIENKENDIQNMKNEIQNLEIEKIQLENKTEKEEKMHNAELINIDKILLENEKLKGENYMWIDKIKSNEQKNQMIISSKDEEIKTLSQDLDFNKKNLVKTKEEKNKEISLLKNEINKCNRDINSLIKKNDSIQNDYDELQSKNEVLQTKLDKKTKELQEINESANKLIENKENLIQQYEDKLEEMTKEKNQLIEQNHELLDKIKSMESLNLGDLLNEDDDNDNNQNNENNDKKDNYETVLLTAEIKALKEQLENQANDLVSLNAMEKEVSRLNIENEKLAADYKALKEKMNKEKYEESADDLMNFVKKQYNNMRTSQKVKLSKLTGIKDNNTSGFEKQIETLKKMKEDEQKSFLNEIDKLKGDIAILKVKHLNQELENETMIAKYKSIIKSINEQCKKKGLKFNINNI